MLPKPEWGRWTTRDGHLFAHIFERGIGPICLRGLEGKIACARLLADGSEVKLERPWNALEYPDDSFITFSQSECPDEWDTVIDLVLK